MPMIVHAAGRDWSEKCLHVQVSIEIIAEVLGYESEAAFRKAFKRAMGIPPAQYRKLG
jgi:AraC-like DNA-binding protein